MLPHLRAAEELAELGVMTEQPVADGRKLILVWHVGTGGDDHFIRAHGEVVARARSLLESLVRPPRRHVRFIRPLVRAEARVAVDAKNGFLRRAHVVGREVRHGIGNFAYDRQHRLFQLGLKLRLARLKPRAVVVAREVAEEGEGFGAEVGEGGGGGGFLGSAPLNSPSKSAASA